MNDLNRAFGKTNLLRAWRWINSNPSYQYKNYFRDSYTAYSITLEQNINELSKRLKNNTYEPSKPTLILLPKNNISTRPYSLLNVEDQIVYQAIVNVIAEKFYSKLKKNYYELTFGNLYAGKKSTFFYRKWDKGYEIFNREIRKTYNDGYKYIATFDLTACYDTIDHNVLCHILEKNGLEKEFTQFLSKILKKWSSNVEIYKGHGIPQGPLTSGLLSEVVLSYFDEKYRKLKDKDSIKYFRYVDDIKLLANDERTLMRMLTRLDFYCKQIGLFPQSSKIEIKEVMNIDKEVASISNIDTEVLISKFLKSKSLSDDFKRTYSGTKVVNKTKFKMFLSAMKPNAKLSNRLTNILSSNPQYYMNICLYFNKYTRKISDRVFDNVLCELRKPETFQVVSSSLIDSIAYNLSEKSEKKMMTFCNEKWLNRKKLNPQMRFAIAKYLLINNKIKYKALKKYLESESDWWVKKSILKYIDGDFYGLPSYYEILKSYLESDNVELYSAAVNEVIEKDIDLTGYSSFDYRAQIMLKFTGNISRAASRPSMIIKLLNEISNSKLPIIDWKKVFGIEHRFAENKLIRACSYSKSDMSALVNILDVFNDMLLDKLFQKDTSIGGYNLGKIGSCLNSSSRFATKYPMTFMYCEHIHELRLQCDLSHPLIKKTKKYTNPIKYKEIYTVRKLLRNSINELATVW